MSYFNERTYVEAMVADALARAQNGRRITRVHIALGEISEVDAGSIQKHWAVISQNTIAENANLYFHRVPAEMQCMACFEKYHPKSGELRCPHCGSFGAKILSGEEFHLESIETEDK